MILYVLILKEFEGLLPGEGEMIRRDSGRTEVRRPALEGGAPTLAMREVSPILGVNGSGGHRRT
jgi:hypothetical protein